MTLTSENKKEIIQLENAFEKEKIDIVTLSIELIQLVIHQYKLKNIDELTCSVHRKLAVILDNHGWLKWYAIPQEYEVNKNGN